MKIIKDDEAAACLDIVILTCGFMLLADGFAGDILSLVAGIMVVTGYGRLLMLNPLFKDRIKKFLGGSLKEKEEELLMADVETHIMLGLSFQGQGYLELALEKFMRVPLSNEAIKEHLFNLGLDCERKKKPSLAIEIYEHILTDGEQETVSERLNMLRGEG